MQLLGLDLSSRQTKEIWRATFPFLVVLGAGIVFILLYSLQFFDRPQMVLSVFGVIMTASGAFLLFGVFLGFLFGIPRTIGDTLPEAKNNNGTSSKLDDSDTNYLPNTNLEQISDWLTKILVGVGLTQVSEITSAIDRLVIKLAPGFGDFTNESQIAINTGFTLVVLVYFSFCGFFLGFLWARLYLPSRFRAADLQQLGQEFAKVNTQLKDFGEKAEKAQQIENQFQCDSEVQILVNRQLNPRFPEVSPEKLDRAIKAASDAKQSSIFIEAEHIRSENWDKPATKTKMERTIPIFRSLINSTAQQPYYRYYGELGFALKDKQDPEWKEAETLLSKAIELRGDWQEHGAWTSYYEFNLAICKIVRDSAFNNGQPSNPPTREAILQNLFTTVESGVLTREKIQNSPIDKWLSLNDISIEELLPSETINPANS